VVGEFTALCAASGIPSAKYPKGKIPDDQRDEAIAQLQARTVRIASAYVTALYFRGLCPVMTDS
jgi:hypothetical protein